MSTSVIAVAEPITKPSKVTLPSKYAYLNSKDDVPKLIKELENPSPSRRQISAFVLGAMGKSTEGNEPLVRFANLRGKMFYSDNFNIEDLKNYDGVVIPGAVSYTHLRAHETLR